MATGEFTPRRIARWLRRYRDWRAKLDAGPTLRSVTDYSRPVVQGGGGESGPLQRYVEEQEELRRRTQTVERWLMMLSPLERLAADYWLADDDGTVTSVAQAAELDWHQARGLVRSIPLIIWGRLYYKRAANT